jgi:hypothetical protein
MVVLVTETRSRGLADVSMAAGIGVDGYVVIIVEVWLSSLAVLD